MNPTISQALGILGSKVRDRVTSFAGVATSVSFDLYGCVQVVIQPGLDKDGKPQDGHWYDFSRLEVTEPERVMVAPPFAGFDVGPAEKPVR